MGRILRRELQLQLIDSLFWTDGTAVLYINCKTTRFHFRNTESVCSISMDANQHTIKPGRLSVKRAEEGNQFVQNQAWISGPYFLAKSADSWPENPDHLKDLATANQESKRNASISAVT